MARRTLKANEKSAMFSGYDYEKAAPGWMASNAGLASSKELLDQLMEDMHIIPPKLPPPEPPKPVLQVIVEAVSPPEDKEPTWWQRELAWVPWRKVCVWSAFFATMWMVAKMKG